MFSIFKSTTKISFKISGCENTINRLRSSLPIYSIKKEDLETYVFITGYTYKDDALSILEECKSETVSVQSGGLLFYIDMYKKRAGIWLGIVLSLFLLCISSVLIWEVRVSGNKYVDDADILLPLKQLGIAEGCFIDRDALENVYNSFLINEPRISWISVNFDGTIANVEVKETELPPEKLDRSKNYNIVANCDGTVKRIDVFDGKGEVGAGDFVAKGELLISSFAESRKTGVFMRAARGNVWATTVRNYEISVKKEQLLKKYDNKFKELNSVIMLGRKLPMYMPHDKSNNTEKSIKRNRAMLFKTFQIPFIIETKTENYWQNEYVSISEKDAGYIAETELDKRIEKDLKNAVIIKKNNITKENESAYIFVYELECYENIACVREFDFE